MKRANQLAHGARPMIKATHDKHLDIALLEIAEGLLAVDRGDGDAASVTDELSSVLDDITID